MDVFIQELLKEGDYVLSQTPEMLPVLKQAGVVDSGGQGLMQVLKVHMMVILEKRSHSPLKSQLHHAL